MSGAADGPMRPPSDFVIRNFQPFDMPGIYEVCLRTGDVGGDATDLYRNPHLLGHVYAGPYSIADPGLAWLAVDQRGIAGYVLGTAHSAAFHHWKEAHWWPGLRQQYPITLTSDAADALRDGNLVRLIHEDPPPDALLLEAYPAHLHIDLLPRAQRQGLGRRLIERLLDSLVERRIPGVHLGVHRDNGNAQGFYHRLGFVNIAEHEHSITMALDLRDR